MNQTDIVINVFNALKKSDQKAVISQATYNQVIRTVNMFITDNSKEK